MSAALLGVVLICCSSSATGAYFYNRKDAKYYENEINLLVNKIIETGARPAQCKLLRDFLTENIEDMEEKGTTFPVKGTQKGDIINVIMSWDDLKEMDKQTGRTKQEKLATLCIYVLYTNFLCPKKRIKAFSGCMAAFYKCGR